MSGTNAVIGGGGFHHVALRAKDFDASLKFYTRGLGFRQVMAWGEGDKRAVMLDTGDGSCLEIFAGGQEPAPVGGFLHVAFTSRDCDAAIEAARKAGANVTMEPQSLTIPSAPPVDVRIAFCTGPDGETIEFFQRVS